MDINLFKTFIIVAKHKSISTASEKVYLSKPAVTKQIKALEQDYGVKFFERNIKKMTLTEDGKHLLYLSFPLTSTLLSPSLKSAIPGESNPLASTIY